ncbi:hypothetical protein Misp04_03940 [Micromonospora sp. NBRC 101691]|nr:hypothetical protein Misp04_03940 [Micromonospora sp. NBRC 101691]
MLPARPEFSYRSVTPSGVRPARELVVGLDEQRRPRFGTVGEQRAVQPTAGALKWIRVR